MRVTHFILLLLFLNVKTSVAQQYKEIQNKANQQYQAKQYEVAAQLYENAFELDDSEYRTENLYNASCSYALSGNKTKAFDCLEEAIDFGWQKIEQANKDTDLNSLKDDIRWQTLKDKIQIQYGKSYKFYFWGMYLGILFILFFYNLFLFFSLKDISLLYYAVLILLYSQFEVTRTPAFAYYSENIFIWQRYFPLLGNAGNFFICLSMVFQLLFTKSFLNLKEIAPRINKTIVFFIIYFILCCSIILVKSSFQIRPIIYTSSLVALIFSFLTGIFCWYKKYRSARFFVIANILYIIGVVIVLLHALNITDIYFRISVFRPDNIGQIAFFSLLSFAIGDKINILKKEKIETQERALEVLEIKVKERMEEVVKQKEIIEEKNKDITDSIQYALRIQTAILPPNKIVKQYLENSFILYKPKDIVAGDFYWMETVNDLVLFAACDCTGHGVPGAMVSVVCHNALNRAVREFGLTQPAAILDKTAEIVIENFSKSEEDIKDGMDISLCAYNIKTKKLQWSGANNPLWLLQNGELIETKADKQPIGMTEDSKPFTNHTFNLNATDTIYLFTDGFADQFGGDTGEKKLTKRRFKDLLLSVQTKSLQEQESTLDKFITDYRKQVEQIDDILVMGVKV